MHACFVLSTNKVTRTSVISSRRVGDIRIFRFCHVDYSRIGLYILIIFKDNSLESIIRHYSLVSSKDIGYYQVLETLKSQTRASDPKVLKLPGTL